jgi:hypothetical protein
MLRERIIRNEKNMLRKKHTKKEKEQKRKRKERTRLTWSKKGNKQPDE